MAYDRNWDENQPPDTQPANLLGQDLRQLKIDIRQRMIMSGPSADMPIPEAVFGSANDGILYLQTDSGKLMRWNGNAWVQVTAVLDGIFYFKAEIISGVYVNNTTYFRVPFDCTLVAIRGLRSGGVSATVNLMHYDVNMGVQGFAMAADLNLINVGQWYSSGALILPAFAAGETAAIQLTTTSGTVQVSVQAEFRRL